MPRGAGPPGFDHSPPERRLASFVIGRHGFDHVALHELSPANGRGRMAPEGYPWGQSVRSVAVIDGGPAPKRPEGRHAAAVGLRLDRVAGRAVETCAGAGLETTQKGRDGGRAVGRGPCLRSREGRLLGRSECEADALEASRRAIKADELSSRLCICAVLRQVRRRRTLNRGGHVPCKNPHRPALTNIEQEPQPEPIRQADIPWALTLQSMANGAMDLHSLIDRSSTPAYEFGNAAHQRAIQLGRAAIMQNILSAETKLADAPVQLDDMPEAMTWIRNSDGTTQILNATADGRLGAVPTPSSRTLQAIALQAIRQAEVEQAKDPRQILVRGLTEILAGDETK